MGGQNSNLSLYNIGKSTNLPGYEQIGEMINRYNNSNALEQESPGRLKLKEGD